MTALTTQLASTPRAGRIGSALPPGACVRQHGPALGQYTKLVIRLGLIDEQLRIAGIRHGVRTR